MKIIAWNCNMAFRKKAAFILKEMPDILVISECENPSLISFHMHPQQPSGIYWHGDLPNKGLGVFSYAGFRIKPLPVHNPVFRYIVPLEIYNEKIKFIVFAIWAQKPEKHDNYLEQIWNAIHFYGDLLCQENIILAGDFNSNSIFDKPKRACNHTAFTNILKDKKIVSAYHEFYKEEQGKETRNTLFLHRNIGSRFI